MDLCSPRSAQEGVESGPIARAGTRTRRARASRSLMNINIQKMINLLVCIFASIVFITIANIFMNICIKKAMVIFAT